MQYEVHFLVEKIITVEASDDIQAELESVKKLSIEERMSVRGAYYSDTIDGVIHLDEFEGVDFDWWRENNLLD